MNSSLLCLDLGSISQVAGRLYTELGIVLLSGPTFDVT